MNEYSGMDHGPGEQLLAVGQEARGQSGVQCRLRSLFGLVNAHSVAVFRIWFGAAAALWAFDYVRTGRVGLVCNPETWHFHYPGFSWVDPWPGAGMKLHFIGLGVLAILIALGAVYRIATLLFALGFTFFFLIDRTNYQNHYYLMLLISWMMPLLPANQVWSLDRLAGRTVRSDRIPRWCLFLVQFHVGLPYLFGGIAKIELDWLSGVPMRFMLLSKGLFAAENQVVLLDIVSLGMAWGGLLFDLLVVPGLVYKRTRRFAFIAAMIFHAMNSLLFDIHIFPLLMIGASTIFFNPDWPRRVFHVGGSERITNPDRSLQQRPRWSGRSTLILSAILIYSMFHIVWPLRHLTYSRLDPAFRTSWTEAGHYFSWRMMLRGKTSGVRFYLTDRINGMTQTPDLRRILTPEQLGKFARDPDLIHQLAHLLADATEAAGHRRPQVRALVLTSLNGRKPQPLVDPQIDLAAIPRGVSKRTFVMALYEPLSRVPWTVPMHEWEQQIEFSLELPGLVRETD